MRPPCKTLDQERSLQSAHLESGISGLTDGLAKSFNVWQGHYALAAEPRVETIYATGACPDFVIEDSPNRHWLYWNPPFFSPHETANDGEGTMSKVIADTEPYVLTARAFQMLLRDAGKSPFDASQPVRPPARVPLRGSKRVGKLVFLLGNLERDLPADAAVPKSLRLRIPASMMHASGTEGHFRDVTGSGSAKTTPGTGRSHGQVQLSSRGQRVKVCGCSGSSRAFSPDRWCGCIRVRAPTGRNNEAQAKGLGFGVGEAIEP